MSISAWTSSRGALRNSKRNGMSVIVIQFHSSQVNAHITCQIASARSAEKVSSGDTFQATTRLEEEVGR